MAVKSHFSCTQIQRERETERGEFYLNFGTSDDTFFGGRKIKVPPFVLVKRVAEPFCPHAVSEVYKCIPQIAPSSENDKQTHQHVKDCRRRFIDSTSQRTSPEKGYIAYSNYLKSWGRQRKSYSERGESDSTSAFLFSSWQCLSSKLINMSLLIKTKNKKSPRLLVCRCT